jgi:hypothetical protein
VLPDIVEYLGESGILEGGLVGYYFYMPGAGVSGYSVRYAVTMESFTPYL